MNSAESLAQTQRNMQPRVNRARIGSAMADSGRIGSKSADSASHLLIGIGSGRQVMKGCQKGELRRKRAKDAVQVNDLQSRAATCSLRKVNNEDQNGAKSTKRAESRGAALANLGNTCFLNSVLQCLIHLIPLVRMLFSVDHAGQCAAGFCCFCALKNQTARSIRSSNSVLKPKEIAKNLKKISEDFKIGKQSDAQEFLNCFLNSLESSMHSNCSKQIAITKEIFGGSLKSMLWCCLCGQGSERSEPFIDLSLEINGRTRTVQNALKSFVKTEFLEGNFYCDDCNRRTSKKGKQLKLEKGPDVLLLHLKRFLNCGSRVQKVSQSVQYPAELDLRPFMVCPKKEEEMKYDLYTLVVHNGTHQYGHYFSFVRTSLSSWYLFNDSKVSSVTLDRALNQEAYLLFYIKKGVAPWFSNLLVDVDEPAVSPTSVLRGQKYPSPPLSLDEDFGPRTVGSTYPKLSNLKRINKTKKGNSLSGCLM